MEQIEFPGLVWVKDPVNLAGDLSGGSPRMRHHDDCMHWYRDAVGNLIGPPAYQASDEQMRSLPPCKDCVESLPGEGSSKADDGVRRGGTCPTCFMEMPLVGGCANCR